MPYKNNEDRKEFSKRNWPKIKARVTIKRELKKEQNIEWKRTSHLKRYGLTQEMFNDIVNSQNGVCAICNKIPIKISKSMEFRNTLYVDHNHKTGKIRGLLCQKCNVKLAAIEDSMFLASAIEYLNKYDPK